MKRIAQLTVADLKKIFRDKTLLFFLFTPVILILFVRYFVPFLTNAYPVVEEYHVMIMMFASAQTAIMFGFISSFIILDEKDENVLQVIRILPITPSYFIFFRLIFAALFSFVGAFAMILLSGIAFPGYLNAFLLSLQYALGAPLITLVVSTYAKNKIEGMAFFKGVDLLLLVPVLSFFIDSWAKYLFGIIPVFWTFQSYDQALSGNDFWIFFLIGSLVYLVVISFLVSQFRKRVFDR
jgi:hypothetical protein